MHARLGTTALLSLFFVGVACSSSTEAPRRSGSSGSAAADDDDDDDDIASGAGSSGAAKDGGSGAGSSGGSSGNAGGSSSGGSSGAAGCAANEEQCPRGCAALDTDMNNCGSCGNVCPTFDGVQVACVAGACTASCDGATEDLCRDNQQRLYCIDIANDPDNCGGCGNSPCHSVQNGTRTCTDGVCGVRCDAGLSACQAGSVCLDLQNDTDNCGSCNRDCTDDEPNNVGGVSCSAGRCRAKGSREVAAACSGGCSPRSCEELCDAAFGNATATWGRIMYVSSAGFSSSCDVPVDMPLDQFVNCDPRYALRDRYRCACDVEFTW